MPASLTLIVSSERVLIFIVTDDGLLIVIGLVRFRGDERFISRNPAMGVCLGDCIVGLVGLCKTW